MEFIGSHFDSELSNNWKWIFSLLDSCCFKFEDSSLCLIVWFHVVVNSGSFSLPGPYWLWGFGFQNLCVAVVRVVWMILGYFLCDLLDFCALARHQERCCWSYKLDLAEIVDPWVSNVVLLYSCGWTFLFCFLAFVLTVLMGFGTSMTYSNCWIFGLLE